MLSLLFVTMVTGSPSWTAKAAPVSRAPAACSQYCHKGVSKPCGNACISQYKQCHKPTTTACVGERPASAKPHYDNPKHVEPNSSEATDGGGAK